MEEIWKDVIGYKWKLQVNNYGLLKEIDYKGTGKERIVPIIKNGNYINVSLPKEGKKYRTTVGMHRLMALAFELERPEHLKDIPFEELEVNHLDENPSNNVIEFNDKGEIIYTNLAWTDDKGNANWGTRNERIGDKLRGRKRPEEVIKKISESKKGKVLTQEHKDKISKGNKGKKRSDKIKQRISEIHKGLLNNRKDLSKPVLQYDLDGTSIREFPSLMEVHRQLGYSPSNISRCCRGERKTAYGFIWKYKKED